MESTLANRRRFLQRCAAATATGLALCLGGCTRDEPAAACADGKADSGLRESLAYREQAANPARSCRNCAFFTGGDKGVCGQCELLQGPVSAGASCSSWSTT